MIDDLKERLKKWPTPLHGEALAHITDLEARLAAAEAGEDALAEAGRKAVVQLIDHGSDGYASGLDAAIADYEARTRAALVSPADGWRRCDGCRAVGAIHCAHPDECGNMKHVSVADLIAQADSWRSWLDDLPLPDDFREGVNDCQQYIADLSYALQPQPAPPASEGADHG